MTTAKDREIVMPIGDEVRIRALATGVLITRLRGPDILWQGSATSPAMAADIVKKQLRAELAQQLPFDSAGASPGEEDS